MALVCGHGFRPNPPTVNLHDYRFLHRVLTTSSVLRAEAAGHAGILSMVGTADPIAWARAIDELTSQGWNLAGRLIVWHGDENGWKEDAWRPGD